MTWIIFMLSGLLEIVLPLLFSAVIIRFGYITANKLIIRQEAYEDNHLKIFPAWKAVLTITLAIFTQMQVIYLIGKYHLGLDPAIFLLIHIASFMVLVASTAKSKLGSKGAVICVSVSIIILLISTFIEMYIFLNRFGS